MLIGQTISIPIINSSQQKQYYRSTDSFTSKPMRSSSFERNESSTTTTYSSSTTDKSITPDSFYFNIKIIAIVVAAFVIGIGIVRLIFMFCKSSRPANNSSANHHATPVRPQLATIELSHFKPDLPPTYGEATATIDNDETKLPSYDELQNEQHSRSTITTAPMQ
ncbi:unnamed protein product [Rotaria magnacalcarata]|uniref:Uncharacterized protein n=1 Tax=Rotaria magnacalcarata TaxID=392030 RepID=A0A816T0M8_9BILA|nr:unnamed protein product [Rotaria magnacalcarata]CAF2090384.1 unnamed protein product [Rotaria magnacalcarata]CAF3937883.1 unnamed protein product [Rotaria magnacalcarata]CAF3938471.1 unnamed protein product [Rotaria magnacalcarata]